MFPVEQGCLAPVYPLMTHPTNTNEIICFNLRFSPEELMTLDADKIQQRLYTRTVDLAEGEQRLPLKGVHLNKSPALAPVSTLTEAQAEKWQIDWGEINTNLDLLLSDPGLIERLAAAYSVEREFEPSDVDSALYEGFIQQSDRLVCNQLLAASPAHLAEWPENSFQDKRLNTLLFRYRARNFPETLNDEESRQWQQFCHSRIIDGEYGSALTLEQFQEHLLTLVQSEQDKREQNLLDQLSRWIQYRFN